MKPTSDLSNKTKAELTALARRKKIPVTSKMLKDELIKTIKKGLRKIEAQKKSKPAQKTSKKKSSKAPKVKTARKPKSTTRKTASTKKIKTATQKKAPDKKSPAKVKVKKAAAKKSAPRKPKAVRSPKKVVSQTRSTPEQTNLPERYNDHRLVALARDPNWAYVYWDLNTARVRDLLSSAKQTADKARWVLRVYSAELHPAEAKGNFFDINIDVKIGSYYLDLSRPGARFIVEIGVIDASGMFRTTAQSNPVALPTDHPSEITAPEGTALSETPDSPARSK
jgi:hypothetical protein